MILPEAFYFKCPLKINCGSHALDHLPVELAAVGARAPLILANGNHIGKKRLKTVVNAFRTSGLTLGIYDGLADRVEPELLSVLANVYRDGGCDSLIVVGSGPVVDMSKCLNATIAGGDLATFDDNGGGDADNSAALAPLMLVAMPDGNGDEATGYVSDGQRRLKASALTPAAAFIDPAMMKRTDDRELAEGALIAMAQAVEAFLDESGSPMGRAYAHTAIGLIVQYLPMALRKNNRDRSVCAVVNGQVAAGCAFSGASANICHSLGARLANPPDLTLGFTLAALLPHLVGYVGTKSPDRGGELLYPLAGEETYAITATELKVSRVMALLWEFFEAVGVELDCTIPSSLVDAGLDTEQIETLLSQLADEPLAKCAAHIIDSARSKPFR
ncbi:alcohol dehydrogenase EutG [Desulfosarcina widdelii]|uniref:Alcohol dehydrogenase EutG n=1 Tax=Desulfosarcina widdelii TaxID=947919 RepID=A0A5K7YXP7_9BACT|nr:iron-containing alcohol dehydrogenase [Desulfosarcina widdelii]BBO73388.1 alcohol dehydrogenase EutG [Desulfosarcina widdelii]